jgi:hypothetical protein
MSPAATLDAAGVFRMTVETYMKVLNNLFRGAPGEGQDAAAAVAAAEGGGGGGGGAADGGAGASLTHSHPLLPNNARSLQAPQAPPSNDYFPPPPEREAGERVAGLSPSSSVDGAGVNGGVGGGARAGEDGNLQMSAEANGTDR